MKQLFMLLATAALYAQTVALYAATPPNHHLDPSDFGRCQHALQL